MPFLESIIFPFQKTCSSTRFRWLLFDFVIGFHKSARNLTIFSNIAVTPRILSP